MEQIYQSLNGQKPGLEVTIKLPKLTPREKETLHYLCRGYTNQELANQLFISKKQVERHKRNLMIKFNVMNDKTLIREAIDLGYEIIE